VAAIVAAVFASMAYNDSGGFSWYLYGPTTGYTTILRARSGTGAGAISSAPMTRMPARTTSYLNGTRAAQMSDTQPLDLNSNPLGIGRHVSGIADPFNGHIDEFRISHIQRSDGWIETTYNNMSNPAAFALAGAEEQEGGGAEPPPLAGTGVVVCLMG
jgi:MSHA biogenesis protein MshQ